MKRKHTGILTKILLVVLLVYAATSLVKMSGKIKEETQKQEEIQQQVDEMKKENEDMEYAIDNSEDESVIEDIARAELGLVYPGEKVFVGD